MSLLMTHRQQDVRPSWPRAQGRRANARARALFGQLARFVLALVLAGGILALLIALKSAAYMAHHPM